MLYLNRIQFLTGYDMGGSSVQRGFTLIGFAVVALVVSFIALFVSSVVTYDVPVLTTVEKMEKLVLMAPREWRAIEQSCQIAGRKDEGMPMIGVGAESAEKVNMAVIMGNRRVLPQYQRCLDLAGFQPLPSWLGLRGQGGTNVDRSPVDGVAITAEFIKRADKVGVVFYNVPTIIAQEMQGRHHRDIGELKGAEKYTLVIFP